MRALVSAMVVVLFSSCELSGASASDPAVSEEADLRSLTPAEILGDLAVGSSHTVLHPGTPLYRAYRFVTAPHTTIDAWARSTTGDAQLWVLGASFQTLGHNDNDPAGGTDAHLRLQLQTGGTYYLAFREASRHSATFTVSLAGDAIDAGTAPPAGQLIDWCGNGIDEDGDGSDRTCVADHVLPDLVRTLVLTASNGSAAMTGEMVQEAHSYNQAAGQVAYPRNVISKVRIENRSGLPAHIEPTLPLTDFGFADLNRAQGQTYDSVTFEIDEGALYRVTLGGYEMYLSPGFSEPVATPTRSQQVVLEGTMNRTPVRVTVSPEVGNQCINDEQNTVDSVDACAGLTTCNVWSRVVVEQLNADATTTVLATYLPPQCPHRTSSEMVWSSRLGRSSGQLAIVGFGTKTGESHQLLITEDPKRPGVLTADPDFRFSDFPKDAHFELHFIAQP